jgi:multicomponent K+:H+ antiporter subunit G
MSPAADLPPWAALITAVLIFLGAAVTLIGALGLLRFKSFYERVHAPTLGTTLGTGCIVLASMIYFSVLETRPVLHEILIAVFITITTPVTLMILVRAAMLRDRWENTQRQGASDRATRPANPQ